ncbi:uncharacterized protein [Ptychodera flava]|uniref:uncharacterized protein n=1 Tax=Ptychodera flava TaxID=63121 RepID=UPI003969EAF9
MILFVVFILRFTDASETDEEFGRERRQATDIVRIAKDYVGSTRYSYDSFWWPGPSKYKCNYFVHDVLEEAGVSAPEREGWIFTGPISASSWFDTAEVKEGCSYVGGASSAQPGDVVADGSHVGIAVGGGKTVSARSDKVVENDWGFRGEYVTVWRCR